jgi:hypothetical protein
MKEVIKEYTSEELGPTYFRGSKPIDGIWITPDVQIANACVMPAGYGIGDHRLFIVDIVASSMIGNDPPRIKCPSARRLNTLLSYVAERYATLYHENVIRHKLIERLADAYNTENDEQAKHKIDKVDYDAGQLMAHAEKKCRQIKTGHRCFSPDNHASWLTLKMYIGISIVYISNLPHTFSCRNNHCEAF